MTRSPQWFALAVLTVAMTLIDMALALVVGVAVVR